MNEDQQTQLPATREQTPQEQLAEYISSEITLELSGYYDAGYKRRYPGQNGAPTSKTVRSSFGLSKFVPTAEYGFPNTLDLDLRRGLEAIIAAQIELREAVTEKGITRRPHPKVPIVCTVYELLTKSGLTTGRKNYDAAVDWVKRNTGTMIEAPILDPRTGKFVVLQTHLFRETITPGDTLPNGDTADKIAIIPADWYLRNIAHRKTLQTDQVFYKALAGYTIAKNLHAALAVGFRASHPDPFRKSYRDICDALNLTFYRYRSKREEKFNPDLAHLHRLGYLEGGPELCTLTDCPQQGSEHGRGFRWDHQKDDSVLYFYAGPKFTADQQAHLDRLERAKAHHVIADRSGSPRIDAAPATEPRPSTETRRFPQSRRQRTGHPYNLTADQVAEAESLAAAVIEKIGHEKNRRFFFTLAAQAIAGHYVQTFWKVLSEVALAHREGRINQSPSAYFAAALKNQAPQLDLIPSPSTTQPASGVGGVGEQATPSEPPEDAAAIRAQIQASFNRVAPPVILARADDLTPPVVLQDVTAPTQPKDEEQDPPPALARASGVDEGP
jgi:hypothetical protein